MPILRYDIPSWLPNQPLAAYQRLLADHYAAWRGSPCEYGYLSPGFRCERGSTWVFVSFAADEAYPLCGRHAGVATRWGATARLGRPAEPTE